MKLNVYDLKLQVNQPTEFRIQNYPNQYPDNIATWVILGGTITVQPIDGAKGVLLSDSSTGESVVAVTLQGATYAILAITTYDSSVIDPLIID